MIDQLPTVWGKIPYEVGALNGLDRRTAVRATTAVARDAWLRGDDSHVVTKDEIEAIVPLLGPDLT